MQQCDSTHKSTHRITRPVCAYPSKSFLGSRCDCHPFGLERAQGAQDGAGARRRFRAVSTVCAPARPAASLRPCRWSPLRRSPAESGPVRRRLVVRAGWLSGLAGYGPAPVVVPTDRPKIAGRGRPGLVPPAWKRDARGVEDASEGAQAPTNRRRRARRPSPAVAGGWTDGTGGRGWAAGMGDWARVCRGGCWII